MIDWICEITGFTTKEVIIFIIAWLYVIGIFKSIGELLEGLRDKNE